jgi:hypothetical protein
VGIITAPETITEKFMEGLSKLLDQRKESALSTGSEPVSENNIGHKASKHLRNKSREYLKDKINELAILENCIGKKNSMV